MEEYWVYVLAIALCFYSGNAFPSNSTAATASLRNFTESSFQENMVTWRNDLQNSWDKKSEISPNLDGSTLAAPNFHVVTKSEVATGVPDVFLPFSREIPPFLSSSTSMQNKSFNMNRGEGDNEEISLIDLQIKGKPSHNIKRKRKSMALLNLKKLNLPSHTNVTKRSHTENKIIIPKTFTEDTQLDNLTLADSDISTTISQDDMIRGEIEDISDKKEKAGSQLILSGKSNLIDSTNRLPSTQTIDAIPPTIPPFHVTKLFPSHSEFDILTTASIHPTSGSVKHIDLQSLEKELAQTEEKKNPELLLAISILQHHVDLKRVSSNGDANLNKGQTLERSNSPSYLQSSEDSDEITNYRLSQNKNNLLKFETPTPSAFSLNVEMNDAFSPSHDLSEDLNERLIENLPSNPSHVSTITPFHYHDMHKKSSKKDFRWFVLVMDGNCTIIRHRMSSFVTFLKAALSSKLEAQYEDIYVPSVFCHKKFMVNISIDSAKYPKAEHKLNSLAGANTTLLELSGEIFYLEKVLCGRALKMVDSASYLVRSDDIQVVIYFAVGCMCIFILLSVIIVSLIKVCRQDDTAGAIVKVESPMKHDILPAKRPNVIYSHNFTQSLSPNKYLLNHEESSTTTSCMGTPFEEDEIVGAISVAPSFSSSKYIDDYLCHSGDNNFKQIDNSYTSGERKNIGVLGSASKLCLLEDLQEEEENSDEDDYKEDTNDVVVEEEEEDYEDDEEDEKEEAEEYIDDQKDDKDQIIIMAKKASVKALREGSQYSLIRSPLYRGFQSLCLPSPSHDVVTPHPDLQTSFENPCYER